MSRWCCQKETKICRTISEMPQGWKKQQHLSVKHQDQQCLFRKKIFFWISLLNEECDPALRPPRHPTHVTLQWCYCVCVLHSRLFCCSSLIFFKPEMGFIDFHSFFAIPPAFFLSPAFTLPLSLFLFPPLSLFQSPSLPLSPLFLPLVWVAIMFYLLPPHLALSRLLLSSV